MKCRVIIGEKETEEIVIWAHQRNELIDEIERLVNESNNLYGYRDNEIISLDLNEIFCFYVENNKIFALTEKEKFLIKSRLYTVENSLDKNFIKINQSCIINIRKIKKFDSSVYGALRVILKNGYEDYVSRRNIKSVKERLGL